MCRAGTTASPAFAPELRNRPHLTLERRRGLAYGGPVSTPRIALVSTLMAMAASAVVMACGPSLPTRYVVERDMGDMRYRRYQKVLDVEFPVEGNAAVGHTASYVRRGTGRDISFATAFVTAYDQPAALVSEVRERLDSLGTYEVSVGELEGEHVWWLDGGGDRWALWVSERYIVKLGAPRGEEIPEDLAEEYTDLYPSDLDENGHAEDGAASGGFSARQQEERDEQLDIPRHLREGAPR